jgi:DNA-binding XRE family transcriptional regulator
VDRPRLVTAYLRLNDGMVSGDLLREARRRAGLSQAELARRAGKPTSVIGRWERGEVKPSLETLAKRRSSMRSRPALPTRAPRRCPGRGDRRRARPHPRGAPGPARGLDRVPARGAREPPCLRAPASSARARCSRRSRPNACRTSSSAGRPPSSRERRTSTSAPTESAPTSTAWQRPFAALERASTACLRSRPKRSGSTGRRSAAAPPGSSSPSTGELDAALDPDGTRGYKDLIRTAAETEAYGLTMKVAALEDVIRSKEAAAARWLPNRRAARRSEGQRARFG